MIYNVDKDRLILIKEREPQQHIYMVRNIYLQIVKYYVCVETRDFHLRLNT